MRLIGSMTTLPSRVSTIIDPIKYILRQSVSLDILYIHIPIKTLKGETYDIPENFLSNFSNFSTKVIINRCKQDYGPITKLAPVLELETDPDTCIFTFDDDIIVHRDVVKKLQEKSLKYPDACLGFSGICVGSFPFYFQYVFNNHIDCPVDWIQGVHVVMYKRKFFNNIDELVSFGDDTPLKNMLVFNDDHRISSYLSCKNIQRISIGYNIKNYLFKYSNSEIDALCKRHIDLHKEHFQIIKYFSNRHIYNHSYSVLMSWVYFTFYGILLGISMYNTLKESKINKIIKIILSILFTIFYWKRVSSRYGLKKFSRILLLK